MVIANGRLGGLSGRLSCMGTLDIHLSDAGVENTFAGSQLYSRDGATFAPLVIAVPNPAPAL